VHSVKSALGVNEKCTGSQWRVHWIVVKSAFSKKCSGCQWKVHWISVKSALDLSEEWVHWIAAKSVFSKSALDSNEKCTGSQWRVHWITAKSASAKSALDVNEKCTRSHSEINGNEQMAIRTQPSGRSTRTKASLLHRFDNGYNGGWPSARLFGWSAADLAPDTNKFISQKESRFHRSDKSRRIKHSDRWPLSSLRSPSRQ
jgi:hypothetical protein